MSDPADPGTDFRPTHVVPGEGLPAWEAPDVARPTASLDPFLPVRLLARRGDWGEILCANGWSAWVDGRLLVAVPQPPPTTGRPLARAEDPAPLLTRAADVLERYRTAARGECGAFRAAVTGLRAGIVIDGESVWVYDDTTGRWLYADGGGRPQTYAVLADPAEAEPEPGPGSGGVDPGARGDTGVGETPRGGRDVPHEPTRVARRPEPGGR
ncbi:hypothetical protein [Streptomyces sp. NPDC048606]|uniref:hypothetical protein n=1 Tax=Streptomyces sp. NPDC048606 TaxID=3154726 RepID=UPI00344140F4